MPKKILVAVDLSKLSQEMVLYACSIAHRLGVEIAFLHVLPHPYLWKGYEPWLPPALDVEVREIARKKIAYYIRKAKDVISEIGEREFQIMIREGNPADVIIETAKTGNFNLVILGYKGQSAIAHLVVGSTASNVARYAHCSVLIYRPGLEVFSIGEGQ